MCDVFISFKKTDDSGNETEDFLLAQKIYAKLTSLGISSFFSGKSLENIGSSDYKNDIDRALDNACVMVVVLARAEHASAKWVKYEWDSFYNDYLTGVKPAAKLFTVLQGVNVHTLPRTLRNVQSLDISQGVDYIGKYVLSALTDMGKAPQRIIPPADIKEDAQDSKLAKYVVLNGTQITDKDIYDAVALDRLVYDEKYWIEPAECIEWFKVNHDIYVMIKERETGKLVAYVNVSPITEECYQKIRSGYFIDVGITADMILSYDMPFPYCLYFSSVVIHPDYQNTGVFMILYNAIIEKFIELGQREVFMKKMIADAVSKEGEKFCKMFGMARVDQTNHNSTLYEVTLIPPMFRVTSSMSKKLYDFYQQKYKEEPYLFED